MKHKILLYVPVITLLLWLVSIQMALDTAERVVLPVEGYDPRDLLSGHYLQIRTRYPIRTDANASGQKLFFCFDNSRLFLKKPDRCKVFIAGENRYGRFSDGVDRFYVPEDKAEPLERLLREGSRKAEIVLSVDRNGSAYATDLLFDGKSWKELPLDHEAGRK